MKDKLIMTFIIGVFGLMVVGAVIAFLYMLSEIERKPFNWQAAAITVVIVGSVSMLATLIDRWRSKN